MTSKSHKSAAQPQAEPPLHTIRGYRVILDSDLARLYGVTTKRLNEAIHRNADRFPSDFVFQLIPKEWEELNRSQIAAASPENIGSSEISTGNLSQIAIRSKNSPMWSQIATTSETSSGHPPVLDSSSRRRATHLPWAFTEHGALMAGTILRSPTAVQMSLYVVRAFVKLRQLALENENLSRRMIEAELALRAHDVILSDIYDKLEPLLDPEPESEPTTTEPAPPRKLGFDTDALRV